VRQVVAAMVLGASIAVAGRRVRRRDTRHVPDAMKKWRVRRFVAAVVLGVSLAVAGPLGADERRPLPPFDLVSPSGVVVTATRFAADERWVLVYVAPNCGSCDRLLAALAQWRTTLPVNHIAVVVESDADVARRYVDEHGIEAAGFAWYADVGGAGARAMDVQRLPALAGLGNGELSWSIDGVLNQPEAVEPAVRGWLTQ
jgi:thiol-disulfide isomerase/thioredoxin